MNRAANLSPKDLWVTQSCRSIQMRNALRTPKRLVHFVIGFGGIWAEIEYLAVT